MNAMADVRYLTQSRLSQVETHFDEERGAFWAYMNPRPRPCFNMQLLADLRSYLDTIVHNDGVIFHGGRQQKVQYGVLASKVPGVFNLGGDLALFRSHIEARNRDALVAYGVRCIDNLYPWYRNCDLPMTTIALVQGEALGGGFEAALSANVLIAEETSRMGFPEILFNLFPGMGAYSFLSRKVGRRMAEEMIGSGTVYAARDLYEMGVVDVITAEGTGEAAVNAYIKRHAKSGNGRRGFARAKAEVDPVTREELVRVVEIWADTAMGIEERDLRMMERLVRAQVKVAACEVDADAPVRLERAG